MPIFLGAAAGVVPLPDQLVIVVAPVIVVLKLEVESHHRPGCYTVLGQLGHRDSQLDVIPTFHDPHSATNKFHIVRVHPIGNQSVNANGVLMVIPRARILPVIMMAIYAYLYGVVVV